MESRRGFYKSFPLFYVLFQFGQARFQQLLLFRSQFPDGMNLFNAIQLEGMLSVWSHLIRTFCTYTELDIG